MSEKLKVIAIDGPAGSGKSTVAKKVAKALNYLYIDTGAMYRALTYKAISLNIDLKDQSALTELAVNTEIKLEVGDDKVRVFCDGKDVSSNIRELSVSEKVKYIAGARSVRSNMVDKQRELGMTSVGAVLEGRDIGTVVFPDAAHKFYIDADFDERVRRRYDEFLSKGSDFSREDVSKDLESRDNADMSREVGALKQADDAVYLDTTDLEIDEVVNKILGMVKDDAAL